MILIPGKLINKANHYEVRINPSLWQEIRSIVTRWKLTHKGPPWWIGPSDEAKTYQQVVAWAVRAQGIGEWLNNEPVSVRVILVGVRQDIDAVKAILDGIQDSGRIANDRQIARLLVEREAGPVGVRLEVQGL